MSASSKIRDTETDDIDCGDGHEDKICGRPADSMKLRAALSKFAHEEGARRILRTSSAGYGASLEGARASIIMNSPSLNGKRRPPSSAGSSSGASPKRSKSTPKRTYAPPEQYEHLRHLSDLLQPGLDIVVCGINPGIMSSTKGHHFANPTNHFWKCLHQSGLTDCFVPPSEDHTLPKRFSIGMTNLVSRPSAEAAELSPEEMREGVVLLFRKLRTYRPKVVCIVGKAIWNAVSFVIEKKPDIQVQRTGLLRNESIESIKTEDTKDRKPSPEKRRKSKKLDFVFGLQLYKLMHQLSSNQETKDILQQSGTKFTLFWVVPSTSGKVVSYQLPDKVKLFRGLKEALTDLNEGKLDTGEMTELHMEVEVKREQVDLPSRISQL